MMDHHVSIDSAVVYIYRHTCSFTGMIVLLTMNWCCIGYGLCAIRTRGLCLARAAFYQLN